MDVGEMRLICLNVTRTYHQRSLVTFAWQNSDGTLQSERLEVEMRSLYADDIQVILDMKGSKNEQASKPSG